MNQNFLSIDEEGYFLLPPETRLTDQKEGLSLYENLTLDPNGACWSVWGGERILVEPFDKPLVASQVFCSNQKWTIELPYGWSQTFDLASLCLDAWDRFHGLTQNKLPFVFSRKAQAEFFNLLDEFEDESITVNGTQYIVPNFYIENPEVSTTQFWSEKYELSTPPPWDLDTAHPALDAILPQLKMTKCRVLNLGCGRGHDAAYFAQKGYIVTGVDLSQNAVDQARQKYSTVQNLKFECADVLSDKSLWETDLIFEHTLFCAISPVKRKSLIKKWTQSLAPQGHLLGVFFVNPHRGGPPFGGSEWELRSLLEKNFRLLYWKRWPLSPPRRHGTELVIYAQKK